MAVTIHDIARELNLSAMTVSRALSQPESSLVKPATRLRVEEVAQRMGYRPNRNAKALASGRTNVIGLWISHWNSSVYARIVQACKKASQSAGLELSVSEMDWHFSAEMKTRRFQWPVDGVIAVDPPPLDVLDKLLRPTPWRDIPRVHLGSGQAVPWDGDYVLVDLGAGTRKAIEHLVSVGCKRIAYLVPPGLAHAGLWNYDAYVESLQAAGIKPECIVTDEWDMPIVRQNVIDYIEANGAPDGIYCHHDEFAIAAFRGLRDLGLDIPQDVALIGSEGNDFLEYFDPPISTVAMPIEEMCRIACQLLSERINSPQSPAQGLTLPFEFLSRPSSR